MKSVASRVQKHRANLRKNGLKLVQIWVPDVGREGFREECKRQSLLVKNAENEQEFNEFLENVADLRGWE